MLGWSRKLCIFIYLILWVSIFESLPNIMKGILFRAHMKFVLLCLNRVIITWRDIRFRIYPQLGILELIDRQVYIFIWANASQCFWWTCRTMWKWYLLEIVRLRWVYRFCCFSIIFINRFFVFFICLATIWPFPLNCVCYKLIFCHFAIFIFQVISVEISSFHQM